MDNKIKVKIKDTKYFDKKYDCVIKDCWSFDHVAHMGRVATGFLDEEGDIFRTEDGCVFSGDEYTLTGISGQLENRESPGYVYSHVFSDDLKQLIECSIQTGYLKAKIELAKER